MKVVMIVSKIPLFKRYYLKQRTTERKASRKEPEQQDSR